MNRAIAHAWLLLVMAPLAVQADVYVSRGADGNLIISNVRREGRAYERVYQEPVAAPDSTAPRVAMGKTMSVAQRPYAEAVSRAAVSNDVPAALLHAVIRTESGYNPRALSVKGAAGLMQLMPDTAREMGVDNVWDPNANIQGGARYLKRLLVMFGNDIPLAVAAYNAGPAAVSKRGNVIPPFAETQRYVPDVMRDYQGLLGHAGARATD